MQKGPLAIVVTRNTLLLVTFAVTLWRVWRLRAAPTAAGTRRRRMPPHGHPPSWTRPGTFAQVRLPAGHGPALRASTPRSATGQFDGHCSRFTRFCRYPCRRAPGIRTPRTNRSARRLHGAHEARETNGASPGTVLRTVPRHAAPIEQAPLQREMTVTASAPHPRAASENPPRMGRSEFRRRPS